MNKEDQDTHNRLQIELHVPDFDIALDFYGKLGFKKVWMRQVHNGGDYLVMERSGTILNFWPGNDAIWGQPYFKNFPKDTKRGYGIEIVIPVDDVEASYQQAKQFAHISSTLKLQPWGVKDFRIEDPFGFYLRVTERHNILDPKYAVPTGGL